MYVKRIVVLKSVAETSFSESFALKAETDLSRGKLLISFINPQQINGGALFLYDGEKCQSLDVTGGELYADLQAKKGLSALVFAPDGRTLFFGASNLLGVTREKLEAMHAQTFDNDFNFDKEIYDDEKIAEFDFYNERRSAESASEDKNQACDDADFKKESEIGDKTQGFAERLSKNESDFKPISREEPPFFATAKAELEAVFSRGTRETKLERVIPDSKWVKICYSRDNYYVVGVVKRDGAPKYICYGVPGRYGSAPEKLKGAAFIPDSLFEPMRDGYFVLFQSAESGNEIKLSSFYSI